MDKKRTKGITIICYLVIASSLVTLFLSLDQKSINFYTKFGVVFLFVGIIFDILAIIFAFNVLKLKEAARKNLIILTIVCMVTLFIPNSLIMDMSKATTSLKDKLKMELNTPKGRAIFEDQLKDLSFEEREKHEKIMENFPEIVINAFTLIVKFIFLLFYLLIIFFFTRRKVKEQFKVEVTDG